MYLCTNTRQTINMYLCTSTRQTINIYSLSVYHWSRLNTMLAVDGALHIQYLFLSFVDSHVETVTNALIVSTNRRHTINTFSQSVCPPGSGWTHYKHGWILVLPKPNSWILVSPTQDMIHVDNTVWNLVVKVNLRPLQQRSRRAFPSALRLQALHDKLVPAYGQRWGLVCKHSSWISTSSQPCGITSGRTTLFSITLSTFIYIKVKAKSPSL